jgi:hypothetical protein
MDVHSATANTCDLEIHNVNEVSKVEYKDSVSSRRIDLVEQNHHT